MGVDRTVWVWMEVWVYMRVDGMVWVWMGQCGCRRDSLGVNGTADVDGTVIV